MAFNSLPDTEACRKIEKEAMRDALILHESNGDEASEDSREIAQGSPAGGKKSFLSAPKTKKIPVAPKDDAEWQREMD